MKVAMFTNTYLPYVGGVAESVERLRANLRARGHDVFVIAPTYDEVAEDDGNVYRIPALKNLSGSDFSMVLPINPDIASRLDKFRPDIVHTHHPYLLGNSAARYAASRDLPLVFTHHTMYEHYACYSPVELKAIKKYIVRMTAGYANFCDAVIAPSPSTAEIIRGRGVETPVYVVPTGVDTALYARGDGAAARRRNGIPAAAVLIGTVCRLAPEKNVEFLARAAAEALKADGERWMLVVGEGSSRRGMQDIFDSAGVGGRVRFAGVLRGRRLRDAYHAMDVFAFASKAETQGVVILESLATGCPVVAMDVPGVRQIVTPGRNGELTAGEDAAAFAAAVGDILSRDDDAKRALREAAIKSAEPFDVNVCAGRVIEIYRRLIRRAPRHKSLKNEDWQKFTSLLEREWDIWSNRFESFSEAVLRQQRSDKN